MEATDDRYSSVTKRPGQIVGSDDGLARAFYRAEQSEKVVGKYPGIADGPKGFAVQDGWEVGVIRGDDAGFQGHGVRGWMDRVVRLLAIYWH